MRLTGHPASNPGGPTAPGAMLLSTLTSILFVLSLYLGGAQAALTAAVSRENDYVEPNARGTMCFYPKAAANPSELDVACVGGRKGEFAAVMAEHLNLTTSINYFSGSLERLGGPEWVLNAQGRRIYLCLSGRAGDYTYQTMCTTVGRDNSLGNPESSPRCKVAMGQRRVTDGCYVPNQDPPPLTITPNTQQPVVTVTRTSTPPTSTVTRGRETPTSANSTADEGNGAMRLGGYSLLGGFNLAIYTTVATLFWL